MGNRKAPAEPKASQEVAIRVRNARPWYRDFSPTVERVLRNHLDTDEMPLTRATAKTLSERVTALCVETGGVESFEDLAVLGKTRKETVLRDSLQQALLQAEILGDALLDSDTQGSAWAAAVTSILGILASSGQMRASEHYEAKVEALHAAALVRDVATVLGGFSAAWTAPIGGLAYYNLSPLVTRSNALAKTADKIIQARVSSQRSGEGLPGASSFEGLSPTESALREFQNETISKLGKTQPKLRHCYELAAELLFYLGSPARDHDGAPYAVRRTLSSILVACLPARLSAPEQFVMTMPSTLEPSFTPMGPQAKSLFTKISNQLRIISQGEKAALESELLTGCWSPLWRSFESDAVGDSEDAVRKSVRDFAQGQRFLERDWRCPTIDFPKIISALVEVFVFALDIKHGDVFKKRPSKV